MVAVQAFFRLQVLDWFLKARTFDKPKKIPSPETRQRDPDRVALGHAAT
jgi:hypothetical protein